jgi:RNA polymerase sigma factor (TIGR02999 family)
MTPPSEVTVLLAGVRHGDRDAFDRLFALVYDELRRRAHFQLAAAAGGRGTLVTTGLVHEAYLKLAATDAPDWEDRRHFYRVAGRAMRQIVIDRARRHRAQKRGGGLSDLDVDALELPARDASERLLALDEALSRLEREAPDAAHVMELTWFVGLSVEEAAQVTGASPRTVKRQRQFARAFLHDLLADTPDSAGPGPDREPGEGTP